MVILNDDSLTLHKVSHKNVRSYLVELNINLDEALLLKSVIKAKDDKFLLSLLLRACASIKWTIDKMRPDF